MLPETFEALASLAEREDEGLRLEFLGVGTGVRRGSGLTPAAASRPWAA